MFEVTRYVGFLAIAIGLLNVSSFPLKSDQQLRVDRIEMVTRDIVKYLDEKIDKERPPKIFQNVVEPPKCEVSVEMYNNLLSNMKKLIEIVKTLTSTDKNDQRQYDGLLSDMVVTAKNHALDEQAVENKPLDAKTWKENDGKDLIEKLVDLKQFLNSKSSDVSTIKKSPPGLHKKDEEAINHDENPSESLKIFDANTLGNLVNDLKSLRKKEFASGMANAPPGLH